MADVSICRVVPCDNTSIPILMPAEKTAKAGLGLGIKRDGPTAAFLRALPRTELLNPHHG